ncbi:hypothetical protein D9M68_830800 [compost metagenome]
MYEGQAITFELLQDKALATKKTGTQALVEADTDRCAIGRAEKGVLLANQGTADLGQRNRHHGTRIGRSEGHPRLLFAGIGEVRHE